MRFAAIAIIVSLAISAPVFGYEVSKHPKADPTGSTYDQGRIQVHQGNWQGAIDLFRIAISEDQNNYKAYTLLGYSLRHAGRISEAIAAYSRAVKINPGYAELREYRGKAYVLAGNVPAAMSDYRTLVAMGSPLAEDLRAAIDRGTRSAN